MSKLHSKDVKHKLGLDLFLSAFPTVCLETRREKEIGKEPPLENGSKHLNTLDYPYFGR